MSMTFEAVFNNGATVYNLNDGSPFRLQSIDGFGPTGTTRFGQRSPLQNGVTDLGYRLKARFIVLTFNFRATSDSQLDTYRQTFTAIFKPTVSTPLQLRVTRDDGAVRVINCFASDKTNIDFSSELRPGHLHRATVTLRAANPVWMDSAPTQATFAGTTTVWWTANGAIGTANVMEHVEYPTQGQLWTYAGTLTGDWTVVFRSAQETGSGTKTAFRVGTASDSTDPKVYWFAASGQWRLNNATGTATLPAGTQNYFVINDDTILHQSSLAYGPGSGTVGASLFSDTPTDISGTARTWRSAPGSASPTRWSNEFPKAAVYNKALSGGERAALDTWMAGSAILGTVTAVNGGHTYLYPLITIRGPIINPILTNTVTGKIIDLTGVTLGSGDVYTIDLTSGDKTIADADGNNRMTAMVTPSQLAAWYLAPAPIAGGGTNTIRVQGGDTSTATQIQLTYTNEYMSE